MVDGDEVLPLVFSELVDFVVFFGAECGDDVFFVGFVEDGVVPEFEAGELATGEQVVDPGDGGVEDGEVGGGGTVFHLRFYY